MIALYAKVRGLHCQHVILMLAVPLHSISTTSHLLPIDIATFILPLFLSWNKAVLFATKLGGFIEHL